MAAVPMGWRRVLSWFYVKQAPMEWVLDMTVAPLRNMCLAIGVVLITQFISNIVVLGPVPTVLIIGGCSLISFSASLYIHKAQSRGWMFATIVGGTYMFNIFGLHLQGFLSSDAFFRMRSHAIITVMFKIIPGAVGVPIVPAILYFVWGILVDAGFLEANHIYHNDPSSIRTHLTSMAYAAGGLALVIPVAARFRIMYQTQEELASKTAMMESMITLMCDASVWISENGRRVLQMDHRFSMIVGRDMTGEDVSSALAEEEHQRLQDCLSRAKTDPVLLPTTLQMHSGAKIPVEMFIVGNCDLKAEGQTVSTPAFLIGLRTANNYDGSGMPMPTGGGMRPEHEKAWEKALTDGAAPPIPEDRQTASALSSVPETTATGRIFDRENFESWTAADDQQEAREDLRQSLERIVELGQREHWIMSARELQIKADMLLGVGAFGVVVGGWLHGSPIAVKTTKRAADNASATHLITIANEIRILRHLRHPNLVLFHGACVEPEEGEMMLVMERVKGPDLYKYVIERSSDRDVLKRFQLLLDVACALRYLHGVRPQVVHGDLKGTNVLVEAAIPRAKLVDFGLSRLLTKHPQPLGGTLNWMAPELICKHFRAPKPSADVFSFGRLAYMIIACRKPMGNLRRSVIEDMAKRGVLPALVWEEGRPLQKECAELCERLLCVQPDDRITMAQAHEWASAWTLPDLEDRMPSLDLARAAKERPGDPGWASAVASFRKVLGAALRQHEAPAPNAGASPREGAGRGTSAMVMAGMFLPDVQQAGDAQTGVALVQPTMGPTQLHVKKSALQEASMKWNFPLGNSCCQFHAAVADLQQTAAEMARDGCQPEFRPHEYQCGTCGVLMRQASRSCRSCEKRNATQTWGRMLTHIQEEGVDEAARADAGLRCSL